MKDALRHIEGLFVGQLTEEELALFNACFDLGWCCQSYEGAAGFMGLARVRLLPAIDL